MYCATRGVPPRLCAVCAVCAASASVGSSSRDLQWSSSLSSLVAAYLAVQGTFSRTASASSLIMPPTLPSAAPDSPSVAAASGSAAVSRSPDAGVSRSSSAGVSRSSSAAVSRSSSAGVSPGLHLQLSRSSSAGVSRSFLCRSLFSLLCRHQFLRHPQQGLLLHYPR